MNAKVIKATGLIPVKLTRDSLPYRRGDIHGFLPPVVEKLLNANPPDAELVDIPDDVATEEVTLALLSEATPAAPEPEKVEVIEIPAKWEKLTEIKLIALAKKFDPAIDTEEAARAAIQAEVDRRAA